MIAAPLHQVLAVPVGLAFCDKFDARSVRRREARAERKAEGAARAAALRAAQRNQTSKK